MRNSLGTVRHIAAGFCGLALIGLAMMGLATPLAAQDGPEIETDVFTIARGGLLYDKWYGVLEHEPPDQTHPAYPAAGKKKGSATWRCKECHGWDYKGADGAYGKGSHFTGIKGIRDYVGKPAAEIEAIIRNETHAYTEDMIPDSAVTKLALFVSLGQIDMDQYIDRETKKARGNVDRGARFYQTICAVCHGFEGKAINFADEQKPEFVGTIGKENPWEALHKIRNGQPGVGMVALGALSVQDQVDILTYTQTLPEK
jgi:thiosulfate dehydrogenase